MWAWKYDFSLRQRVLRGVLLFLLLPLLNVSADAVEAADSQDENFCSSESGVCTNPHADTLPLCSTMGEHLCGGDYKEHKKPMLPSIYRFGGTAQSYKSMSRIKTTICDVSTYRGKKYRVASWPFWRSMRRNGAPKLILRANVWTCNRDESSKENIQSTSSCCCRPMNSMEQEAEIEIWQARPDGTYSSIRPGVEEGDCRAKMILSEWEDEDSGNKVSFMFETVAPGSYGIFGGLGPATWDFPPYGAPVIHFLVTAPGHAPTLIDVPILLDFKTLKSNSFLVGDFRGPAWVKDKSFARDVPGYKISAWEPNVEANEVKIDIDIFLQFVDVEIAASSPSTHLCQSWVHALPPAFFVEPISECTPSLLDFFAL